MALSGPFSILGGGLSGPQARGYGYAPTFFPGTAIPGEAQPVVLSVDARASDEAVPRMNVRRSTGFLAMSTPWVCATQPSRDRQPGSTLKSTT